MRLLVSILCVIVHTTPCPAQKKGPMTPFEDVPGLPRVLLIGDSISIGYTLPTRAVLQGVANVHRIPTNGGPTSKGLENLEAWLGASKWDVIHFNWGLWDLCYRHPQSKEQGRRDKKRGTLTTPLDQYEKNLDRLAGRLKKTKAKLIWAHTTTVPEGEAGRKVGDDDRYNEAAVRVMKKHGIRINDLNSLTDGFPPELFVKPGDVHYTAEGSKKIGEAVAKEISEALSL